MTELDNPARRALLQQLAVAGSLMALAPAAPAAGLSATASLPLLAPEDPAAQASHYVGDARQAPSAQPGANCANCSLYGKVTDDTGSCSLFPRNRVRAAGWCNAWSSL